jgi:hypothetical protein
VSATGNWGMAKAAEWYAADGIPVFPIHHVRRGKYSCGDSKCDSPGTAGHPEGSKAKDESGATSSAYVDGSETVRIMRACHRCGQERRGAASAESAGEWRLVT